MRLNGMPRPNHSFTLLLAASLALPLAAQTAVPAGTGTPFKDTSSIKPPAGAKVAIIEFEDLECPACAHAYPIVHQAVDQYKIAMVRHDFPLKMHIWSFDAAVDARYIQDKISPTIAEEYRGKVFASQNNIASKEDLLKFTQNFFQSKGGQMPFVVDPQGVFAKEVREDYALGEKVGLNQTPTIFAAL
jgi:protein-disulfide isomerase